MGKVKVKSKKKESYTVEEVKAQLVRVLADYDNLKKRTQRERSEMIRFAGASLVSNLLPVLDNLESAQIHLKDPGLQISINSFKEILDDEGVEQIVAQKDGKFDEGVHEAVETIEGKGKPGIIARVIMTGWKFADGPVIRPAKVEVYKK